MDLGPEGLGGDSGGLGRSERRAWSSELVGAFAHPFHCWFAGSTRRCQDPCHP